MHNRLFEAKYYETYSIANVVHKTISDPFPYLHTLEAFYGDEAYSGFISKFPKYSAFHQFIAFIIDYWLFDEMQSVDVEELREMEKRYHFVPTHITNYRELPINHALSYYNIEHFSFEEWLSEQSKTFETATEDDTFEYFQELRLVGILDVLLERMVEEVFFIMFLNRETLKKFNEMIANFVIGKICINGLNSDEAELFKRDGVLNRASIPSWVRNAVFYRDRGRCALCNKNLSGLLSLDSEEHFDHIVPLAQGGLNDVSNVQLLCNQCNLQKGARNNITSRYYEKWY